MTVLNGSDEPLRVTVEGSIRRAWRGRRASTSSSPGRLLGDRHLPGRRPIDGRVLTVEVQVAAPAGRVLEVQPLTVRSTVYNRIALFITIGAAVLLLALWARRFLPRRTS